LARNRRLSSFRLRERIAIAEIKEGLKNVAVCNVQHDYIDRLGLNSAVNEFVAANGRRLQLFGKTEMANISTNCDSAIT